MISTVVTCSSSLLPLSPSPISISSSSSPFLRFSTLYPQSAPRVRVRASSTSSPISVNGSDPFFLRWARAAILIGATAAMVGKLSQFPARADAPATVTEEATLGDETVSPLSEFLESNSDAVQGLISLLQRKLENFEDEEALKILKRLISVQPAATEWKFLTARLLNEMGKTRDARTVFEEILAENPQSFEALFENALLVDSCGEGEAVIEQLQDAAAEEGKDARLVMAQIQFLQKNVDEALSSYQTLAMEDPNDFRPYFCQGVIYSLLGQDAEANEHFAKYRELSPNKFEVEGFARSPLSRTKVFERDGSN